MLSTSLYDYEQFFYNEACTICEEPTQTYIRALQDYLNKVIVSLIVTFCKFFEAILSI